MERLQDGGQAFPRTRNTGVGGMTLRGEAPPVQDKPSMAEIHRLDDHRPHFMISTGEMSVHVVPECLLVDIAAGKKTVDCLECRDTLLAAILRDWLRTHGVEVRP